MPSHTQLFEATNTVPCWRGIVADATVLNISSVSVCSNTVTWCTSFEGKRWCWICLMVVLSILVKSLYVRGRCGTVLFLCSSMTILIMDQYSISGESCLGNLPLNWGRFRSSKHDKLEKVSIDLKVDGLAPWYVQ